MQGREKERSGLRDEDWVRDHVGLERIGWILVE